MATLSITNPNGNITDTLYLIIRQFGTGTPYRTDTSATETTGNINNTNRVHYAWACVPLSPTEGNRYTCTITLSASVYSIELWLRVGISVSIDNDILISSGSIIWNGTTEIDIYTYLGGMLSSINSGLSTNNTLITTMMNTVNNTITSTVANDLEAIEADISNIPDAVANQAQIKKLIERSIGNTIITTTGKIKIYDPVDSSTLVMTGTIINNDTLGQTVTWDATPIP